MVVVCSGIYRPISPEKRRRNKLLTGAALTTVAVSAVAVVAWLVRGGLGTRAAAVVAR